MPDDSIPLRVTFAGEVDHGKSTLIGRLLLDAGGITRDRLTTSVENGGLAFLMDGLAEERADLFTMDTAQAVVESEGRRIVLIDVPGHVELLRNMVTGAADANVGVIVVDATCGVTPQTYRYANILRLLGITTLVSAVTKMDLVDYRESAFAATASDAARVAAAVGAELAAVVPVSAIEARNVTRDEPPGGPLSWYAGRNLLRTLHALTLTRAVQERLRFAVQSLVRQGDDVLAAGRVESGLLRPGHVLVDGERGDCYRVLSIERFAEPPLPAAGPGDCVALRLEGEPPMPMAILCAPESPMRTGDTWTVRLLGIAERPLTVGSECTIRRIGSTVKGRIEGIEQADAVQFGEIVVGRIKLSAPSAADTVVECPRTARLMVCDARGQAVALGVIEAVAELSRDALLTGARA